MAIEHYDMQQYLSGGAANADPNVSLGGVVSSEYMLRSNYSRDSSLITGVTVKKSFMGSGNNDAEMSYVKTGNLLSFADLSGGAHGAAVDISLDGTYLIISAWNDFGSPDNLGYIIVGVVAANLPALDQTDQFTFVGDAPHTLFDQLGSQDLLLGETTYRCLYFKNDHAADPLSVVRAYMQVQPISNTALEIGLDPAGLNGVATTIASEGIAPAGVVFSAPSTYATGLNLGTVASGDFYALWLKRIVQADSVGTGNQIGGDLLFQGVQ